MPALAAVLTLRGVTKRWPGAPPVLDGVGLEVAPGTTVAVTGRNGAGKTTLLRIAAGLIAADAGQVEVAGHALERERTAALRRLGFVSAGNVGLYGRLGVEQHLALWSRLALVPRGARAGLIRLAVADFALDGLLGRRVDRLSMGQRQRLRLAGAFLHEPTVVLLDEPRTSLDADGAALVAQAVERVRARGGAAVICAPSAEDCPVRLDRCLRVADGRLEAA